MGEGVLYFPYMSVPQDEWFVRVLLYWDRVGSVIPSFEAEDALSPFTKELQTAGLLEAIHPDRVLEPSQLAEFIEVLDRAPDIAEAKPVSKGAKTTRVHLGKLGLDVGRELAERDLADGGPGPWLQVEEVTAGRFMTFLSAVLASSDEVRMRPITDVTQLLEAYVTDDDERRRQEVQALRLAVLDEALPAPTEPVSVSDLERFKERHGERLNSFRLAIERALIDLASTSDKIVREMKLAVLSEEIGAELKAIEGQLRKKWRNRAGAVAGVIPAGLGTATAVAAQNPLAVVGSLSPLASAIGRAAGQARSRELLESPLAYGALLRTDWT
jgi:hypothetical protein